MSEAMPNNEEVEFQNKINKIVEKNSFDSEEGRKKASEELNDFLRDINKLNIGRDLIAHIYESGDKSVKVDIFCRNERMDELNLKLSMLCKDMVGNAKEIKETKAYIEELNRVAKYL